MRLGAEGGAVSGRDSLDHVKWFCKYAKAYCGEGMRGPKGPKKMDECRSTEIFSIKAKVKKAIKT